MQTFREMFRYGDAATDRILDAAAALDDAALDRPLDLGMGSVREILRHLAAAEETWVARVGGEAQAPFRQGQMPRDVAGLRSLLHALRPRRDALLGGGDALDADLDYRDSKGGLYRAARRQMFLQLALHSHHHRAQLANALRRAGGAALDLDFMYAVRRDGEPASGEPRHGVP